MADEQKVEETPIENPVAEEATEEPKEEETPEEAPEETPQEETETPKETEETYSEKEKRLYARMKKAEDEAKKAKTDLTKVKEDLAKAKIPISDVDAILEVRQATDDLDTEEVEELKNRASIIGSKLSDARKDKNFRLWQKAHREEVEKAKAATPTTVQAEQAKPKGVFETARELGGRTLDRDGKTVIAEDSIKKDVARLAEKEAFLEKHGMWQHPRKAMRLDKVNIGPYPTQK